MTRRRKYGPIRVIQKRFGHVLASLKLQSSLVAMLFEDRDVTHITMWRKKTGLYTVKLENRSLRKSLMLHGVRMP